MAGVTESTGEWAGRVLAAVPERDWALQESGYDPLLEREVESRFAVGNGLIGVRGSLEIPTPASRPLTSVAGFFDSPPGGTSAPVLVPAPDWLRLVLTVDGREVALGEDSFPQHSRTLDMRRGTLLSTWDCRSPSGKSVRVETLRIASHSERRLTIQVVRLQSEAAARFSFQALLVPVTLALILDRLEGDVSLWRTAGSGRGLTIATRAILQRAGGTELPYEIDGLTRRWTWVGRPGEAATFVRTVAFAAYGDVSERDRDIARAMAGASVAAAPAALASHERAWSERWQASDVSIEGDDQAQRAVRFAVYQLNSAANPEDERVSIGARGLTGDGYGGHVFWDTEIFLLPFYTLTWPEAARALLMYRYHTLPAARAKASRLAYAGALYAWESADSG